MKDEAKRAADKPAEPKKDEPNEAPASSDSKRVPPPLPSRRQPATPLPTPTGTNRDSSGVKMLASLPAPPLDYRWVHTGSKLLDLPTVPISSVDGAYKPFSVDENTRIEAVWAALPEDRRAEITEVWGKEDGEWGETHKSRKDKEKEKKDKDKKKEKSNGDKKSGKSTPAARPATPGDVPSPPSASAPQSDVDDLPEELEKSELYKSILEQAQSDPERLDVVKGVPVAQVCFTHAIGADSQDALFEVDLQTLSLHPVFWPQSGPRIPVIRGTWFMSDETKPCTWDLAAEIEKGYQ